MWHLIITTLNLTECNFHTRLFPGRVNTCELVICLSNAFLTYINYFPSGFMKNERFRYGRPTRNGINDNGNEPRQDSMSTCTNSGQPKCVTPHTDTGQCYFYFGSYCIYIVQRNKTRLHKRIHVVQLHQTIKLTEMYNLYELFIRRAFVTAL